MMIVVPVLFVQILIDSVLEVEVNLVPVTVFHRNYTLRRNVHEGCDSRRGYLLFQILSVLSL